MVSAEAVTFTCSEETGADLGTVELDRMAARIDIVNAVTDLTVDKVVLKNAVIAGNITGEAMPSGDIFEDAACEEELSGDPESPAVLSLYTPLHLRQSADRRRAPSFRGDYLYLCR